MRCCECAQTTMCGWQPALQLSLHPPQSCATSIFRQRLILFSAPCPLLLHAQSEVGMLTEARLALERSLQSESSARQATDRNLESTEVALHDSEQQRRKLEHQVCTDGRGLRALGAAPSGHRGGGSSEGAPTGTCLLACGHPPTVSMGRARSID
jgi:hypothetical protein